MHVNTDTVFTGEIDNRVLLQNDVAEILRHIGDDVQPSIQGFNDGAGVKNGFDRGALFVTVQLMRLTIDNPGSGI